LVNLIFDRDLNHVNDELIKLLNAKFILDRENFQMNIVWIVDGAPGDEISFCLAPGDETEASIGARILHRAFVKSEVPFSKEFIPAEVIGGEVCETLPYKKGDVITIDVAAMSADRANTSPIFNSVKKNGIIVPASDTTGIINEKSNPPPTFKPEKIMDAPAFTAGAKPFVSTITVWMK